MSKNKNNSGILTLARNFVSNVGNLFLDPGQASAPAVDTGAPLQFQYPMGYNWQGLANSKRRTPFELLRAFADMCAVLRGVIEHKKEEFSGLEWSISARDPEDENDYSAEIKTIKKFFERPDRVHTFYDWIGSALEEVFVIDALTIYKTKNKAGKLFGLDLVDGSTIKPLIDRFGRIPFPPQPAYQQIIYGQNVGNYTIDQMIYKPKNLTTKTVYGFAPVEYVLCQVNLIMRREEFFLEYYNSGTFPEGGLVMAPPDWSVTQIRQYQEFWNTLEGAKERNRTRIIPGTTRGYINTKQFTFDPAFEEWLTKIICVAFGISYQSFIEQMNRATSETADQKQIRTGLKPLKSYFEDIFNDIIEVDFGCPHLCFKFKEAEIINEETLVNKNVAYVGAGIYTVNEVRAKEGLPPIEEPEPDETEEANEPEEKQDDKKEVLDEELKRFEKVAIGNLKKNSRKNSGQK